MLIIVDDAPKHIPPLDRPRARATGERDRALLLQALVRTALVVEGHEGRQYPQQVALVQDEQVVQTLPAGTANPALRVAIRLRTARRCPDDAQDFTAAEIVELRRFALGLRGDHDAIRAGLTLPASNSD